MLAHTGPRLWCVTLAAGIAMFVLPQVASAAAPVCTAGTTMVHIPAGSSHPNPRPPCTDADGDAITIHTDVAPAFGSLSPLGDVSIDTPQIYTALANAAGQDDTMTFHAVANGEPSAENFSVDVQIGEPNAAPTCDNTSATVQAGHTVAVPLSCTDPDGNSLTIDAGAPAHGAFANGSYTPAAGFTGTDTFTFTATDEWDAPSSPATATITVTPAPSVPPPATKPKAPVTTHPSPPLADVRAPSLDLLAPASLASRRALRRGIAFTASTSEAGRLSVQLFVGRNTARRYRIDRHATSRVLVGTLTRELSKGDNAIKVKLFRKARTRLRTAPSVTLKMIARITDAAGNVRTKRLRITLERM